MILSGLIQIIWILLDFFKPNGLLNNPDQRYHLRGALLTRHSRSCTQRRRQHGFFWRIKMRGSRRRRRSRRRRTAGIGRQGRPSRRCRILWRRHLRRGGGSGVMKCRGRVRASSGGGCGGGSDGRCVVFRSSRRGELAGRSGRRKRGLRWPQTSGSGGGGG